MAEDVGNPDRQVTVIKKEWLDGAPIAVHCRCGKTVTIFARFSETYVVCPRCESKLWTPLESGELPIQTSHSPREANIDFVEITLSNGKKFVATPDHRVRVRRPSEDDDDGNIQG